MHRDIKCIQTSSVNLDETAVRDHNARETFQQRGFPGAILPDYSQCLSRTDLKGDIFERHKILVVLFTEEDLPEPVGR